MALAVRRRPEVWVAVLAVLKAGGAYLPLDPSYPERRLSFLYADSGARLLLADGPGVAAADLRLDVNEMLREPAPAGGAGGASGPENLAYVLYTSGSTGRPKGVMIPHAALVSHGRAVVRRYGLTASDRALQLASTSFDVAAEEVFPTWLAGGTVVVPELQGPLSLGEITRLAESFGVTVLNLPASLCHAWADELAAVPKTLRLVVAGSERLAGAKVVAWRRLAGGGLALKNAYGTTETTITSTVYDLPAAGGPAAGGPTDAAKPPATVPVGRPLDHARVHLLDAGGREATAGGAGEIAVAGDGLARGYLGRSGLTAERFVPDPLGGEPGARLYRTGDLGRWNVEADLELLGRIDEQVKVRGVRVEPGEVEAALREHPAVHDVAVVSSAALAAASGKGGGEAASLVAYVVARLDADRRRQEEHVAQARELYESFYAEPVRDPAFHVVGWNSSYTGRPIPGDEMRDWVERGVARVLSLRPRRVLEVGCGTGLFLYRIAPRAERYVGTDFSPAVIAALQAQEELRALPQVEVEARSADDLSGFAPGSFDTVVLNGVLQHFPDVGYLLRVLDGLAQVTAAGGTIFVGDIRSLPLLEAFCASVELYRAAGELPLAVVRERIRQRARREEELLVDPAFFHALKRRLPRLREVVTRPRGGRAGNELTRFRYDAVLRLDEARGSLGGAAWSDGGHAGHLARELRTVERVATSTASTVAELRREIDAAERLGARASRPPSGEAAPGRAEGKSRRDACAPSCGRDNEVPWHAYANHPLKDPLGRGLVPRLLSFAEDRLPEPLRPAAYVVLDELPLLPSGKVDRRALPAPGRRRPYLETAFVAPRTATEKAVAAIWSEVLGIPGIGAHDDFFDLGGHSLLATQVLSRLRRRFSQELELRQLFAGPTVAELSVLVEEAAPTAAQALVAVDRDGETPLSFAQQRLWFLQQLDPESAVYNGLEAYRLLGELDATVLRGALYALVRRHESLRTRFPSAGGRPRQEIVPAAEVARLPVVDLADLPADRRSGEVERLAVREGTRPFDLERGPLVRTTLLRLGAAEHVLLLDQHHVVTDGWSDDIFFRELSALYAAGLLGRPAGLPEPRIQYADFAVWQRRRLVGEVLEGLLSYWREELRGLPRTELPTDRPRRSDGRAQRGASVALAAGREVTEALERLGRSAGATPYMTFLAAFLAAVGRWTGQRDLAVGSPVANRDREEIEGLIGFFVNVLVLRVDLGERGRSAGVSFRELLRRVREKTLAAQAHRDLPFEKLVQEMRPEREAERNPLFQLSFALLSSRRAPVELAGLAVTRLPTPVRATTDLDWQLWQGEEGLAGVAVFPRELFDATTVRRWARHYEALLAGVAEDADRPLGELPLLAAGERHQLLVEWNTTAPDEVSAACLHHLFEAQARRTPRAVAAVEGDVELSYRELDRRAGLLAGRLRGLGVGPDVVAGVCFERSLEMMIALLGVLKAGGAYLPLDPSLPRAQLRHVLAETAPPAVLTLERLLPRFSGLALERIAVDRERWEASESAAPAAVSGENLAYVLYTSGSTGKPKGTLVSHRAACGFVSRARSFLGIDAGDRVLQRTPLVFDMSLEELFTPLAAGARVVLAPPRLLPGPEGLGALLRRHGITFLAAVPSLFRGYLQHGGLDDGVALRHVFAGGEVLEEGLARDLSERLPGCRIWNVYGPTEIIICTAWHVRPGDAGEVPIGRPSFENKVYVVGRGPDPLPIGAVGEIVVAGSGCARGYLELPGRTAEFFVPDPFAGVPGARCYRTGDRGRWRGDGALLFLGRSDHQVKIHGVRVELGEIEAVVSGHPAVRQAAVLRVPQAAGEPRLVAFVGLDGGEPSQEEWRRFLSERLPPVMWPDVFVRVAELPRLLSGKVDRAALARHELPAVSVPYAPPRSPAERTLAAVWERVLGQRVGRQDNFFELGGDSILSIRIVAEARKAGFDLGVREIFLHQTLAELARAAGAPTERQEDRRERPAFSLAGLDRQELAAICPGEIEAAFPLSPLQEGMLFHSLYSPGAAAYLVQSSWRLRGEVDAAALRGAWQQAVARHQVLRTSFVWEGLERPLQVVHREVELPWTEHDWRGEPSPEERLETFLAEDRSRDFDLSQAPLLRLALVRLDEERSHLVKSSHHLLLDAWSTEIVQGEVLAGYRATRRGETEDVRARRPYRDYVAWLGEQAREPAEAFWRGALAGFRVATPLPGDRGLSGDRHDPGDPAEYELRLDVAASAAVETFARRHRLTFSTVVQGAWALLLSRSGGGGDVVLGVALAGRPAELPGCDEMVGLFLNTLPLRIRLAPRDRVVPWLRELQERHLELWRHEHSALVDVEGWSEVAPRHPLFESLLVVENLPPSLAATSGADGLVVEEIREHGTGHFPLTFVARPGREIVLGLSFDRRRFLPTGIRRLLRHAASLLAGLLRDGARLAEVSQLTAAERHQLCCEWSGRSSSPSWSESTLDGLFEEQARRTPEAVAVAGAERLSYRELDARASGLARELRRRGVGPEARVALCLERGAEMVVAVLAVLKAGGAYVPLEPREPPERRERLIATSGAVAVVTSGLRVSSRSPRGSRPGRPRPGRSRPGHAAYVVFTSGSTGEPRGVVVEHRQAAGYVRSVAERLGFEPGMSYAMVQPLSVDSPVIVFFGALLTGGTLHLVPELDAVDPEVLRRFFRSHRIDVLKIAPTHLAALETEDGWAGVMPRRRLVLGGELLRRDRALTWLKTSSSSPSLRIDNHYGPTEATVGTHTHRVGEELEKSGSPGVPIGRPLAASRSWIVVGDLRPVAAGVVGELVLGGPCVARGYLDRPAATAASFVPDPLSGVPGERLYRSGDLARHLDDGTVEVLGRRDEQVKLRGFRIELGEIEAALGRHARVREAAVALCGEDGDEPRLWAYVVPTGDPGPAVAELRGLLARQLPRHMVPAVFTFLAELPRRPHGKVDRKALAGTPAAPPRPAFAAAPRTPIEEIVGEIWCEVLRRDTVRRDDDFFELGGHSLLATQVISRLRRALEVELPLRSLFETTTLAGLASAAEAALGVGSRLPAIELERRGAGAQASQGVAASFAQQRLWFLHQLAPASPAYNTPAVFELAGELDVAVLAASLRRIVGRHEVLRTALDTVGGRPVQRILPEVELGLPRIDLTALPPARRWSELTRRTAVEVCRPFDLTRAPLVRACLLRRAAREHVLVVTLHHVVSDGWSRGILYRELMELYRALSQGRPPALLELEVQYADFAVWQRRYLRGEILEEHAAYWRRQLAGLEPVPLPADRPRPAEPTYRAGLRKLELADDLAAGLRHVTLRGLDAAASLYMTLLTAFLVHVGRLSGRVDVAVGSPIANRTRQEIEPLIGFFVNLLVMRGDLSRNPSFTGLLARLRRTALEAYAHQDLPFERLIEELRPERDFSRHPLVQIAFVVENAPLDSVELPGLKVRELETPPSGARFDLELFLWEESGRLEACFVYSVDLFDATTVGRFAKQYGTLLRAVVASRGERRLDELPLLGEGERHQLLHEWSSTARAARGGLVHELFAAQAARAPDAVALRFSRVEVTYRELSERAAGLARRLRRLGVGPERLVGIEIERSPEMVIAVLAVLRAGGAYVPLDPAEPEARRAAVREDAGLELVLTRQDLGRERVRVEGGADLWPDNTAYVLHTSGSTGRPKGVAVSHRALASYLRWAVAAYGGGDAVLSSSLAYDLTVTSLFVPLVSGGCLHVVPEEPGVDALRRVVARRRAGLVKLTPSHLAPLADGDLGEGPGVLVLGGEALFGQQLRTWRKRWPGTRFWNEYGPTEATVGCVAHEVGEPAQGAVPVGRPIGGVAVRVLDAGLRPVPPGVAGELCVGGASLARGYLRQPAGTAAAFVPDPWGVGERLYRTGDLVRFLAGGELTFLGRRDHQLKVRGARVEPGEVETALCRHPAVAEAAVVASAGGQLVAFAVEEAAARQACEQERLNHWREVYEDLYEDAAGGELAGWTSSLTGQAIPREEMEEWIERTVEHVLATAPERVLEIGCGTGLVLRRVAPHVREVWGTDFSPSALAELAARLEAEDLRHKARLLERPADDFAGLPERAFDTVVLSSVAQYFPSADYLAGVLTDAVEATAPGGAVLVGDVRGLALADELYAAVERRHAGGELAPEDLRQRVARRRFQERELVVDPGFFHGLCDELPRLAGVRILEREGRFQNELNLYRYDVVLEVDGKGPGRAAAIPRLSAYANDPLRAAATRRLEPELRDLLRRRLPEALVPSSFVVLRELPRGPSGKVDRAALVRTASDPGRVRPGLEKAFVAPGDAAEEALAKVWCQVLGLDRVGVRDNFFALGGDSILSIRIVAKAREAGLELAPKDLFRYQTVAELAEVAGAKGREPVPPVRAARVGRVPLTPIQRWFFERSLPRPGHYNWSILLRPTEALPAAAVERAAAVLGERHDALRLRFRRGADGLWHQRLAGDAGSVPFARVDLTRLGGAASRAVERVTRRLEESLDLERGPLLRWAWIATADGPRLFFTIHHLAVDAVSWEVFLEELEAACRSLAAGRRPRLPAPTTAFSAWAALLVDEERSDATRRELEHWLSLPAPPPLPLDFSGTRHGACNREADAATLVARLDAVRTKSLLGAAPAVYRARAQDLLLTALARVLARWTGHRSSLVELEGHGREDLGAGADLSRTVGWLTAAFPVVLTVDALTVDALTVDAAGDFGEALLAVKEQLRAVPRRGIGWGLLRYLAGGSTSRRMARRAPPEVSFNYFSRLGAPPARHALFVQADERRGPAKDPRGPRGAVLALTAAVVGGRLELSWTFSRKLHRPATVERLASGFVAELEGLIAHCLEPGAGGVTPSDFPLAGLDPAELARTVGAGQGVEDVYPLSPAQQGMLFHALYERDAPAYFEQFVWTLQGELDAGAMRRAWERLVERHPILRTSFVAGERPMQVVHQRVKLPWREDDWSDLAAGEARRRLEALLAAERARGLDLDRPPLLRLVLVRLGAREHLLIRSSHHLLLDGWSSQRLRRELSLLYEGRSAGPRPRPYRDYIAWLAGRDRAAAERFWRRTLAGFVEPTLLAGGAAKGWQRVDESVALGAAATASLEGFARHRRLTLNTVIQGAWTLLLARRAGRTDVAFGVTVSGRPASLPGASEMVGPFLNTLPLRTRIDEGDEVARFLAALQSHNLELREYEHTRLVDVFSWSDVGRRRPLFDHILVFESFAAAASVATRGGLRITASEGHSLTHYPLTLAAVPGRELELWASYDPGSFEKTEVRRLLRRWAGLLSSLEEKPRARLAEIAALSGAERRQVTAPATVRPEVAKKAPAAPESGLERALAEIWAEIFEADRIAPGDDFFALGGHSLLAVRLAARIERRLGCELPLAALFENPTLGGLAEWLRRYRPAPAGPLVEVQPGNGAGEPPFFCVHPAGGSVLCYAALARHLGPARPFYGLEGTLDGGGRESVSSLAVTYLAAIREVEPDGPYFLGGWSMGGVIAFEIACQICAQGGKVALLALLDSSVPGGFALEEAPEILRAFAEDLGLGEALLSVEPTLEEIHERAVREGIWDDGVEPETTRTLFRRFRRHVRAVERYLPSSFPGRLTLFRPRDTGGRDPLRGWGELAHGGVELILVPGDHRTMIRGPHVRELARRLGSELSSQRRTASRARRAIVP